MEKNTSWEANSRSASQDSPSFIEPEGASPYSQEPATGPYAEPDESSSHPPTLFL
jgi:hypothetical protein